MKAAPRITWIPNKNSGSLSTPEGEAEEKRVLVKLLREGSSISGGRAVKRKVPHGLVSNC